MLRLLAKPVRLRRNPYIERFYAGLDAAGIQVSPLTWWGLLWRRPHLIHVHWPDLRLGHPSRIKALWGSLRLLLLVDLARLGGARLLWTVHNLQPHEKRHPRLVAWFYARWLARIDGLLHLSESGARLAAETWAIPARVHQVVVPHPHYRGCYPDTCSRTSARTRLGLPQTARVLVFLGQIRAYKNVPALIAAWRACAAAEVHLVIAGSRGREVAPLTPEPGLHIYERFIPDSELQYFYRAADLAVFPYQDILNSGSAICALSFDCPVLVPDRGAMGDLAEQIGSGWVRRYAGALDAEALRQALAESPPEPVCDVQALDPARLRARFAAFCRSLLALDPSQ